MRAYRLAGAARDPGCLEGAVGAALWDAGAIGLAIDGDDVVAVYASEDGIEVPPGGHWEAVDDSDHVARYQASLGPVDVGPLVVAPTHAEARLRPGQTVVWLDPGMAFGSGHHATTRLALAGLAALDLAGKRVLDVGCGSGVLAISAERLGAAEAWGIDVDPVAVAVARDNARGNRSRAHFVAGAFGEVPVTPAVDVLVANLYAELHVAFLEAYAEAVVVGGDVLLTGILDPRDDLVRAALHATAKRWSEPEWRCDGEWWLVHVRRRA